VDSWDDLQDDGGNTLHIGKLEYKTKHGKKPGSFLDNVLPRDVKSALCLLVNLFLEQPKIKDEDSKISDSLMKLIETSAINEGLYANSFGKVSSFVLRFIRIHLLYDFISYMNPLIILPISFYIYSSSTIMPHSSVEGEHYFCPVCDRLFVHGAVV
jgi:hypothetical protein